MKQEVRHIVLLHRRFGRLALVIERNLLVRVLHFDQLQLVVAAFVRAVFHAAFAAAGRGIAGKFYCRTGFLAHAVMDLQYQPAANGEVDKGNCYDEEFLHNDLLQRYSTKQEFAIRVC